MNDIHYHYDQLTDNERQLVDDILKFAIDQRETFEPPIPLMGTDPCERAADALAKWIIESRKK